MEIPGQISAEIDKMRYVRKGPGNLLGKAAFYSCLLTACACVWGVAPGSAAATTLQQAVGPLTFDFLYPTTMNDTNLGMFAFPDTGQTVTVPFGIGVEVAIPGASPTISPVNLFEIDVAPATITIRFLLTGSDPIEFVNNDVVIIKMTTTQSSLINLISLESETGIELHPGAFLFGSNFFQVALSGASTIGPGATLDFSVSYNLSTTPVPEPSTWGMMALGFAGLGLVGARHARKRVAGAA
jgi:hypothetical protein